MATSSFSGLVQDDLSCPVCFELLKDPNTPKELDCPHVCCALCIQNMIEGGRPTVDCPECRHVTRIPKDGVTAMRTNFRLRSLAEKHEEHVTKKDASVLCKVHNIIISFFCTKCHVAGCSTCMMEQHQGCEHDVSKVVDVHRDHKEQLNVIFHKMDGEIQECMESIKNLETLQKFMNMDLDEQHKSIEKQLHKTIQTAKENASQLKKQLDIIEKPKIDKVRKVKHRLKKHMQELKQSKFDTCLSHEYVEQHTAIAESLTCELGKDCTVPDDLDPVIGKARFRFGGSSVKVGSVPQVKTCKLTQQQELGVIWCRGNRSVATTADGLLVVCVDRCILCIYRRQLNGEYKKETSITLSKKVTTERPTCVAISADDKFLVARNACLEIYSSTGEYEGTFDFQPGSGDKDVCEHICPGWALVENDIGMIIADWVNSNIVHFTHKGVFVDTIPVPFLPYCAALMPNGLIAVSNWKEHRVCVIDLETKQLVNILDIENANALCFHEQSDTLMVGRCLKREKDGNLDGSTGVIEQYSPTTGKFVARVFENTSGSLSMPQDMVFTNDNRLIVGDFFVVRIYDVTSGI